MPNSNAFKRRMVDAYKRRRRIARNNSQRAFMVGDFEVAAQYEDEAEVADSNLRKWQKTLARSSR